jgi:thymidine kinase
LELRKKGFSFKTIFVLENNSWAYVIFINLAGKVLKVCFKKKEVVVVGFTAMPYVQGKLTIISGPVKSGKTERIESFLDALVDSGYKKGNNVVVVRHPNDDSEPEKIGRHEVKVTSEVEDIYNSVQDETRTVIVVGASLYKDPAIIELADAVVRSNRDMITCGLNLDWNGMPHDYMPNLMALADEIILQKATCFHSRCGYTESTRSIRNSETGSGYLPACTHHWTYHNASPCSRSDMGKLVLYVGPMFSGKSTSWRREIKKVRGSGADPILFKWIGDTRYGTIRKELFETGDITLHNGRSMQAVTIDRPVHIKEYLERHPEKREIFIDEIQFVRGIEGEWDTYKLCLELLSAGYHIYANGLPRDFARKPFGDLPKLMCLADRVEINYATCKKCGHPASDNQRVLVTSEGRRFPASVGGDQVMVGGSDDYEPRCLEHWKLRGEPENRFYLDKFRFV